MISLELDNGYCTVKASGDHTSDLAKELITSMHIFFTSFAEDNDTYDTYEIYQMFVEAFNDGKPLAWKSILKEIREGRG